MPHVVACPRCRASFRLPAGALGQDVRCPRCGGSFTPQVGRPRVPPPPPPLPAAAPFANLTADRPRSAGRRRGLGLLGVLAVALLAVLVMTAATGALIWWVVGQSPSPVTATLVEEKKPAPPQRPVDKPTPSGVERDPPREPEGPRPAPPPVAKAADPATNIDGLQLTRVSIDAAGVLPCLCWDRGGKAFFVADRGGVVRRFAADDFRELARLDLGRACAWAALSSEGLAVSVPGAAEVWLADAATLKVTRKFAAPGVGVAVVVPSGRLAVVVGRTSARVLDLSSGKTSAVYQGELDVPALSPDGRRLFALAADECLHRFGVGADGLKPEQATSRIALDGRAVEVSPDGKYVCAPSGGGNHGAGGYATFVYEADDLSKPAFTLTQGLYPRRVAFDPVTRWIYANNFIEQLIVFDDRGSRRKAFQLGSAPENEVRQMLVHPDGRRLLLLTDQHLYHARLPAK